MIIHIAQFDAPELDVYARLSERQLQHFAEPAPGLFLAESPAVIYRALDAGYRPVSFLVEERQLTRKGGEVLAYAGVHAVQGSGQSGRFGQNDVTASDIPVFTADTQTLSKLTGFHLTSGVLCAMRRRELPSVRDICAGARRIAVLERVVNPTNLGAIIRSAAALGMDAVVLSPDCCDPLFRRAIRVSMGTVFQVPWTFAEGTAEAWYADGNGIRTLQKLGFHTVAMALRNDTCKVDDPKFPTFPKLAIVLGSEGDGLADGTIAACDDTVKIPMTNGVDSLNVAAASAVAFWNLSISD